jgi:hypothetical protein|tara:strand:+ start:1209 stop:1394 length:186 start_codon:yes stop_codon:yes gene_type:complete
MMGIKRGDLVRMKTHDTGLVGIVIDRDYHHSSTQIAIKWFKGSGKVDWEPETWLEVVSESK